ncbi:hypothetical protein SH584_03115 [Sphingomonas sp. LY29]|uniref:hypothetical protein n=1 Tax=Sphingomonas sp. LY29 TaxID=3095341 RepID=UPI002D79009A|nr:hypothetical protein [Sphingomonas sp. LY29]WRP26443.1 hypothetical protein SH584_03115 [Sphingomonas sp. LY29]
MKNDYRTHPAELPILIGAALLLVAATAWAAWRLSAEPIPVVGAVALASLLAAFAVWKTFASDDHLLLQRFEVESFDECVEEEPLLLDDPLVPVENSSRVVRLFDANGASPGDLVVRISDFLGERAAPAPVVGEAAVVDASEALYAALANIRTSLR